MVTNLNLPKRHKVVMDVPLYKRFLAFIVDYLVADFFIITYFNRPFQELIPKGLNTGDTMNYFNSNPGIVGKLSFLMALMGFLVFLYFMISQKYFGQTIGMKLFNLRLISENKKRNIESWQFIVRNLFLIPTIPFIFLWIIDPIYLIIYNRKFTDKISKVRLVEEKTI